MAKKLLYDYVFDASAQTVTINGHVDLKKLLFINNATRGTTIYALGDSNLRVTNTSYASATDQTTFTLNFDTATANHADADKLQIFIDEEGAEFKPTETFVDPVSKLRVSNPNTLIDTDFEYGLQSTKWETLERIHQVPSFYSSTGDVPLEGVDKIESVNNSKEVTVTMKAPHGLVNGIPLDIRGLSDLFAEGTFIIKAVPSDKTFVYESTRPLTTTGDLKTVYTNVIVGRFYVGSKLDFGQYSAVTTDQAAQSTLTITTPVETNFALGTQFYITNSIAVKRKEFDGRSFTSGGSVDWEENISQYETNQMTLWEPKGTDTQQFLVANASYMDSSTNTITHNINGVATDHNLVTGDMMFMVYKNGNVTGFQAAGQTGTNASSTNPGNGIYYVIRVDAQNYQLADSASNCAGSNPVSFTLSDAGQAATQLEMTLFGRGYQSTTMNPYEFDIIEVGDKTDPAWGRKQRYFWPESINASQDTIKIPRHQFKDGQPVVFVSGPSPNGTPGNMSNGYPYYIKYVDADTIRLTTSFSSRDPSHNGPYYGAGVGGQHNITSQGNLYTWGTPYSLWPAIKLAQSVTNNASGGAQNSASWSNRNRVICEHSVVNLEEGDKVVFFSQSNVPSGLTQTSNNWSQNMKDRIYYVRFPAINTGVSTNNFEFSVSRTPNGPLVDITGWSNVESSFVLKVEELATSNTWFSTQHGFDNNEEGQPNYWLKYRFDAQNSTGSAVGNMTANYWYWMIPVTNNHFRVTLASSSTSNTQPNNTNQYNQQNARSNIINITSFSGDVTNFRHKFRGEDIDNPYEDTFYIPNHGFTSGTAVRYNSNGNPAIGGLQNGTTYYVRNASTDRFELSTTFDGVRLNMSSGSATSTPNHYFEDVSPKGAIDGSFEITAKNADNLRYDLQADTQIFGKTITFQPQQTLDLKRGRFRINDHGLKTGVSVVYTKDAAGTAIGQNPPPDATQQAAGYTSLTSGDTYYVYRISKDYFGLATTLANAQAGIIITEYFNFGDAVSTNRQHTLYANSVFGEVTGNGLLTYTTKDKTWNGSSDANVNTYSNYITIGTHEFYNGDEVEYNGFAGATPIVGLEFGEKYFIHRWNSTIISFHKTRSDAYRRRNQIRLFGPGTGSLHVVRIATNLLKGTVDRGKWNSTSEYFAGDIVQYRYNYQGQQTDLYYVATQDSQGNYDDLRYNYSNATNVNRTPPNGVRDAWWKRLNDYTEPVSTGGGLETNMINQYTPGENILLDDERYVGYGYGYGYFNYNSVSNGNTTVTVPGSNYHNFEIGDAVYYRNEGKWRALEDDIESGSIPTDYSGLVDGSIYFVNTINYYQFTLHQNQEDARQGVNPITLGNSTGSSSYYNQHRFYKTESRVVPARIRSISDSDEMTVDEPQTPAVITFDPQSTSPITICDISTEIFYFGTTDDEGNDISDQMLTGTRVIYSHDDNSSAIGGLTKDGNYFLINLGGGYFRLAGDGNNNYTQRQYSYSGSRRDITSTGQGNAHSISISTENYNNVSYLLPTALYVKPSSYALHRPFDGGVEINPGTSADSSVVRQTRRYFRYQSGKGLQYSTATNFNPPIEVRSLIGGTDANNNPIATVVTRRPHFMNVGDGLSMRDTTVATGTNHYNTENGVVATVTDDFTFTYTLAGTVSDITPAGFPTLNKNSWTNSVVRAGMFDDQNGFFFEFDGQYLYAVRRSSTQQCAGTVTCTYGSQIVDGNGTVFTKQLAPDDYVVIRGQSYKVAFVVSDTRLYLTRTYQGITSPQIIMTKTEDTKTRQSDFNIDRCDGSGQTGFEMDLKKLQMCYIDYSWYGGGKIRYGFKDQFGKVFYAHQYVHSNKFTEAYFRSGNLPARYEVANIGDRTGTARFSPSLFHWGASVIMDGLFEDDKAYLFSSSTDTIYLLNQKSDGDEDQANREYPMLSLRLAPSVDAGVTGNLGTRDLINRMQLQMKQVSITISDGGTSVDSFTNNQNQDPRKSCTVKLLLNADLSQPNWDAVDAPSLSEVIQHSHSTDTEFAKLTDRTSAGINIFEFRAAANDTTVVELGEVATLGNSILGGDYTFPNGPDTLTVVVIPDDSYTGGSRRYTICSARISWSESQA